MKMKIYKGYVFEPVDEGYGKEWSVYQGSKQDHLSGKSEWVCTCKTLKQAKERVS